MNGTAKERIEKKLVGLAWEIDDAKARLADKAKKLAGWADRAVKATEELLNDNPCDMSWPDFAEGYVREAKEAKAELLNLIEKKKMLEYILKDDVPV